MHVVGWDGLFIWDWFCPKSKLSVHIFVQLNTILGKKTCTLPKLVEMRMNFEVSAMILLASDAY